MTQERAARARRRAPRQDDETLDPEQAEALSKAAREAVRQPADPRLEKSFAHLGLVPDPEPTTTPKRARTRKPAAVPTAREVEPAVPAARAEPSPPPAPVIDLQPLAEAVASLARTTDEIRRRLELLTWMLAGALLLMALMAVVLLIRG